MKNAKCGHFDLQRSDLRIYPLDLLILYVTLCFVNDLLKVFQFSFACCSVGFEDDPKHCRFEAFATRAGWEWERF